nr:transposase, Ptta/En/Spm [Tanacetum cinerariifolium]
MVHPSDGKAWKHFNSTHPTFSKEIQNLLIKELKTLWNDGVETYDAYRKNNFNMKATILWTVSDFHAYAMLSGRSTHDLEKLQKSIVEIICKLEIIFPPGFFDSLEHLVVHLVWEALLDGLVQYRWMYLYERLFDNYIMQEDPYIDEETLDRARDEKFTQWFKEHIQSNGGNEHLKILARGTMRYVESHKEVGDAYIKVSENEKEFVDTYENLDVNKAEEEFIDRYDDSDDENELALSDHSFDKDEVNLSDHSSDEDEVNLSDYSSDEDEVNLSDHSLNDYLLIIINWTRYAEIMARDNNSKGRGRGRGRVRSGNKRGIGGSSSNVSGFGNQEDANYDNGSRSGGRGRGRNGNISISGGSNVFGFHNQDAYYDNGSRSGGRGRGISGNIGGRGSCCTSEFSNPDADFDTNDNETETETSQRIRGCGIHQDGKKSNVARQNRLTEVDGQVSKHTVGSKTILQHNFQMEKEKKRPVSLLEAYHRTHASINVSSEVSRSGMDEASEGKTREYVTASSKRVPDVVEAAIMEKHGPDVSEHPHNDFDLLGEATGGGKKVN